MFRTLLLAITFCCCAMGAAAQTAWVQVEARTGLAAATQRAEAYAGRLDNVAGFRLRGSWHAIVLGPFTPEQARAELQRLRGQRAIPRDSFITDGGAFREQFFGSNTAVVVPTQPTVPVQTPDPVVEAEPIPVDETPQQARRSERDLTRAEREEIQRALEILGFYNSGIDGAFGPGTRRAMADWQVANGYEQTGILTTSQRREVVSVIREAVDSLGLRLVNDNQAGVEILMPEALVRFEGYDAPFAKYVGEDVQVLLISQSGDRNTLAGLYDVMQTLEIVPLDGERNLGRARFTLTGANDRIVSYTFAELTRDGVKGFTVVWPAGDELRRSLLIQRMQASFRSMDGTVLPDTAGNPSVQRPDLLAGLQVRRPTVTASGFYVDSQGSVLTTAAAVASCSRITVGEDVAAQIVGSDAELGVALIRPTSRQAPLSVGRISAQVPRLQSDVAVAGYSYGGVLGSPTISFGTLEDLRSLDGNEAVTRLALNVQPGDAGGPVLDAGGSVLGMLLPKPGSATQTLPGDVHYAADAEAIAAFLADNGVSLQSVGDTPTLAPEDLAILGADITVLVECWE
ncbi:MAG: serine protease [Pseudomonadota bacterium]